MELVVKTESSIGTQLWTDLTTAYQTELFPPTICRTSIRSTRLNPAYASD